MNCKEFIQRIKDVKFPYHLSDTEEQINNVSCDDLHSKIIFNFTSKEPFFKRGNQEFFEDPKHFDNSTMSSLGQSPFNSYSKQGNPFNSRFRFFADEIYRNNQRQNVKRRKIKCASLERVALEELQIFYRYDYSSKRIKKMV